MKDINIVSINNKYILDYNYNSMKIYPKVIILNKKQLGDNSYVNSSKNKKFYRT